MKFRKKPFIDKILDKKLWPSYRPKIIQESKPKQTSVRRSYSLRNRNPEENEDESAQDADEDEPESEIRPSIRHGSKKISRLPFSVKKVL